MKHAKTVPAGSSRVITRRSRIARQSNYRNEMGRNVFDEHVRKWASLELLSAMRWYRSQLRRYVDDETNLEHSFKQDLARALSIIKTQVGKSPPSAKVTREVTKALAGMASFNESDFRRIEIITKMKIHFEEERNLFPGTSYFDPDRVELIQKGCVIIREWVQQSDDKPANMFMASLATIREIFILDSTPGKDLLWYGLQRLRETFQNESKEVLGQWAFCHKNHGNSWRQLVRDSQDIEDAVRFRILGVRMAGMGQKFILEKEKLQIRQQLRGKFLVPKCCFVPRTAGPEFYNCKFASV